MSKQNITAISVQPLPLDSINSTSEAHEEHENFSELREDIGTPLDDEPELGDNPASDSLNVGIARQESTSIDQGTDNSEAGIASQKRENLASDVGIRRQMLAKLAVDVIPSDEPAWREQISRPNSSSAATPTQDDNNSPVDLATISAPNTRPQFLNFDQPVSSTSKRSDETSDLIGSIPLPQLEEDGTEADIAIVDAISHVNVIPINVDAGLSDKNSDIRYISDHEETEKDEFGRDVPRKRKKIKEFEHKVVTIEEVSDDDLPEVIEETTTRSREGEERISDADSNYSLVSNNSLSAENCRASDKEKKKRGNDPKNFFHGGATEKDEISSLSGLSSEDELGGNERLQVSLRHLFMLPKWDFILFLHLL